jgi:hypothetical protein
MKWILLAALLLPQEEEGKRNRLIVHEWGTFTAVYGADGTMLEWRPLETESDLPSFVYDPSRFRPSLEDPERKSSIRTFQRMETPVIYFYADREMEVDVSVAFPKGRITEWYPRVRDYRPRNNDVANGWLRWGRIKVMPDAKVELPREKGESHYYPARETDAAIVRVCPTSDEYEKTEHEKFLFYRGVGNFALPLTLKAKGNGAFAISNPGRRAIGHVFVLTVKKDGKGKYAFFEAIRPGQTREITLDVSENWLTKEQLIRRISEELEECLVVEGLYRKEAKAMIRTWTDSYFEQEGTRVLYLLPQETTDELLPLSVSPKPVETRRVIVARVEVLTPEQIGAFVAELSDETVAKHGRFAEPMLKEAARTAKRAEIRERAEAMLKKIERR